MTIEEVVKHCRKYNARPVYSGICENCKGIFYRFLVGRTNTGNFCSAKCNIANQKSRTYSVKCSNCANEIEKKRFDIRGQKYWFCSKNCLVKFIIKYPNYPSMKIAKNGYVRSWFGKQEFMVHRAIMEYTLGRKLDRKEEVHHLDHNRLNNTIKNLKLIYKKDHALLHANENHYRRGRDKLGRFNHDKIS